MDYRSVDFIQDPNEDFLIVAAGSDGYKSNIRVVKHTDVLVKSLFPEEGRFSQVRFLRTQGRGRVSGFVAGSDRGALSIFPYPLGDTVLDQVTAHAGEVTKIVISPD